MKLEPGVILFARRARAPLTAASSPLVVIKAAHSLVPFESGHVVVLVQVYSVPIGLTLILSKPYFMKNFEIIRENAENEA